MYLRNLNPSETSDYTLWKVIKKLKQPQQTSPIMKQQELTNRKQTHLQNICRLVRVFIPNRRRALERVFDRRGSDD
jgi:hypothetical protein